ncbi:MAG: hypothetical protein KBA17_09500 [Aliarcobacter sp.]|nr:hypothetical protein [Aliarcobacter sp.]
MKTKNKSFLEDTFILFIIGLIIYAIYSFLFSSNENTQTEEPKITIEEKVETPLINETIDNKLKNDEAIFEEIKEEHIPIEQKEITPIEEIKTDIKSKVVTSSLENKVETRNIDQKDQVELFYETIREKINKNIETTPANEGEYINIKLTILKDGRYEQLILADGNKEYFEKIKSSITKVFPVKIDDNLKDSFPRYFRMKIGN